MGRNLSGAHTPPPPGGGGGGKAFRLGVGSSRLKKTVGVLFFFRGEPQKKPSSNQKGGVLFGWGGVLSAAARSRDSAAVFDLAARGPCLSCWKTYVPEAPGKAWNSLRWWAQTANYYTPPDSLPLNSVSQGDRTGGTTVISYTCLGKTGRSAGLWFFQHQWGLCNKRFFLLIWAR